LRHVDGDEKADEQKAYLRPRRHRLKHTASHVLIRAGCTRTLRTTRGRHGRTQETAPSGSHDDVKKRFARTQYEAWLCQAAPRPCVSRRPAGLGNGYSLMGNRKQKRAQRGPRTAHNIQHVSHNRPGGA